MFEAFIVTTSSEGLSALGSREQRNFELITDTVRDHLGEDHAALFGEPVATEHGDRYDWYAPVQGRPRKLPDLPGDEADALRTRLDTLSADIAALADRLSSDGSADGQRLGEALHNALRVPGDEYIYAVGEGDSARPVLVNWAWVGDEHRSERGALTGRDTRRTAAASAAAATAAGAAAGTTAQADTATATDTGAGTREKRPFAFLPWLLGLGWLALAGMLAAIVWLLIAPCAVNGPAWLSFCPAAAAEAPVLRAETAALEDQIDQLERRIAIADRACQPPPPEPRVIQEAAPQADFSERLERAGAALGDLNFSLAWDGGSDVDLAVTCPSGQTVAFNQRNACNGHLDVDSNVATIRPEPIENVFFNGPQPGQYTIRITLFTKRQLTPVPFEVLIRDASGSRVESGTLETERQSWTMTYTYTGTP